MKHKALILAAFCFWIAGSSSARADLVSYNQDFESLNIASGTALSDNGWLVFGNVFSPSGSYLYGYGPFGAPNPGGGFSAIATGEGGANQGSQYLNVYSDYNNNAEHTNGNTVEANVYQQQTIGAADVGQTYTFRFDHLANPSAAPAGSANTLAFIKVLDPNNGFATVRFDTFSTTSASTTVWTEGTQMNITIEAGWTGGADAHLLQFGFLAASTNFNPTGVFYDNIQFGLQAIPEPGASLLLLVGCSAAAWRRRRA